VRGILGWGSYLPLRRLDRTTIRPVAGTGGGKGTRTVAGYDEDSTTMGVAAARAALRAADPDRIDALWFASTSPAYADKTNATAIHAALRLPRRVASYDVIGSVRSALAAQRAALTATGEALVVAADLRSGLPGSADESAGGDAAVALLVGADGDGPVLAELVGAASTSEEFLDRWRTPGHYAAKVWEERFGETRYVDLGLDAWQDALTTAGVHAEDVDRVVVAGLHERAVTAVGRKLGVSAERLADRLTDTIGNPGAAQPGLLLAAALETAVPGQLIAQVSLSDGADVVLWRTTDAIAAYHPTRTVAQQAATGRPISYGKALAWRGVLPVEPPRRPEPSRPSASAAGRSRDWKYGFVGSRSETGSVHLPPSVQDLKPQPMADALGTVATFTVDRLAYSPSPPVVFAVVDFDGGGRLPVELTDVDADQVGIGDRVEMTFRKLYTADGIHNYFWKARPLPDGGSSA
jgi:3-hydroxy-3-methylglutaryl CoA synthase/uncharacterized OB-fold protein